MSKQNEEVENKTLEFDVMPGADRIDDDASPQPPTEEDGSTFGGYAGDGTTTDPTDEGADTAEPGYDDNSQMPPSTDLLARARWAANVRMAQKKRTMKKRTMSLKVPMTKMEESLQDDPTFMQFCGAYCPAGCNTEADCLGDSAKREVVGDAMPGNPLLPLIFVQLLERRESSACRHGGGEGPGPVHVRDRK